MTGVDSLRAIVARLRTLLDHFDRYASVPGDPTPYAGSPFEAEVRAALDATTAEEATDG